MLIGLLRGNISNGKPEKNRILEFEDEFADLASRVQAFFWVLACNTQGQRGFWDRGSGTGVLGHPVARLCEPPGTQIPGPRTPRCPCV